MKIVPPAQNEPLVDASGRLTGVWYEKLKLLFERDMRGLPDVDTTGLVNGQVLIWNAVANRFKPGAN